MGPGLGFPVAPFQGQAEVGGERFKKGGGGHFQDPAVEGPPTDMRKDQPGACPCHAHVEEPPFLCIVPVPEEGAGDELFLAPGYEDDRPLQAL